MTPTEAQALMEQVQQFLRTLSICEAVEPQHPYQQKQFEKNLHALDQLSAFLEEQEDPFEHDGERQSDGFTEIWVCFNGCRRCELEKAVWVKVLQNLLDEKAGQWFLISHHSSCTACIEFRCDSCPRCIIQQKIEEAKK